MALTFPAPMLNIDRFYTGLYTQRNPLTPPIKVFGRRIIELYDAWISATNVEITNKLTLRRRPGYLSYNVNTIPGIPQKFYSFQPVNNLYPIVDTTTGVFRFFPGPSIPAQLQSKVSGQQTSFIPVGSYLYMGNVDFLKKVDQNLNVTNWGISIGSVSSFVGPTTAGLGTDVNLGAGNPWASPNNVTSSTNFATVTITSNSDSDFATNFGFSIPSTDAITGISVTFDASATAGGTQTAMQVAMLKGGTITGGSKNQILTSTVATYTLGSSSDLWGTTWIPNDINQTNFGASFIANLFGGSSTVSLRNVRITIFVLGGPAISVSASSGTFSAVSGYNYVFAYGSSQDGSMSNPTPVSLSTGAFSSKLNVAVTLTASTDPQVNQIRVFRTTDGGGSVFFELPTSPYPNLSGNITDNAPDNTLIIQNQIIAPSVDRTPPPAGLQLMEWYGGRLWGAVNNLLYFSAGPDILPNTGNGNTSWPPGNVFALPTTINKTVAMPFGLLVFTLDEVHIATGIQNPGFAVNRYIKKLGIRQQNAVDVDGSNIYVFTSDRQFLNISANGIEQVGQNIGDQLDSILPQFAYVAVHRNGSQDNHVFLGNGTTLIFPYNLTQGAWEGIQHPNFGCTALGSIETSVGISSFLVGQSTAGQLIAQRDLGTNTDFGTSYSWNAFFGSIPVADPGQLAIVRSLVLKMSNPTPLPQVFFLPNEISGTGLQLNASIPPLDMPSEYAGTPYASQTYQAKEFLTETANIAEGLMHCQFNIVGQSVNSPDELLGWSLYGPQPPFQQQAEQLPQLQGR